MIRTLVKYINKDIITLTITLDNNITCVCVFNFFINIGHVFYIGILVL